MNKRILIILTGVLIAVAIYAQTPANPQTAFVRVTATGNADEGLAIAKQSGAEVGRCLLTFSPVYGYVCDMVVPVGTSTVTLTKAGVVFVPNSADVLVTFDDHASVAFAETGGPTPTPTPSPTATPTPTPSPTPTVTPTPLPNCTPNQLIGSPPVCNCTTHVFGNPKRCR